MTGTVAGSVILATDDSVCQKVVRPCAIIGPVSLLPGQPLRNYYDYSRGWFFATTQSLPATSPAGGDISALNLASTGSAAA